MRPGALARRRLARHRAIWPLVALALIFAVDGVISPGFFTIRIVEGRLFGSLIDILYRAMPTAIVALGMAVVIGTKGIDLSVGSIIAIVGAVHRPGAFMRAIRMSCIAAARARDGPAVRAVERASWSPFSTSSRSSRR